MQARVQKWGNSLAIRIPKTLAVRIGLTEGTPVEFSLHDDAITIRAERYDLETLLAAITPDNLHEEIDTGKPVGREAW